MMKLKKEKILVSLVVITLITLVFGSIYSLATTPLITGESTSDGNTTGAVNNEANNTANNTNTSGGAIVGSTVNNTANDAANNTNNTVNNTAGNTSNNTTNKTSTNSSSLPYAGTNSSVVFIVVALVASALYAYKKVSDYNV